jgi:AdoMet-dependent heme synthase
VFFLVPTGRAQPDDVASADEFEHVFHRMYDLSKTAPFDIKSTAAPQYRRVVLQRQVAERRAGDRARRRSPMTAGVGFSLADGVGRSKGVNDGDGFLFISHTGAIYPSGFLPLAAGNVRRHDLVDVYRNAPLFTALRDRSAAEGQVRRLRVPRRLRRQPRACLRRDRRHARVGAVLRARAGALPPAGGGG